GGGSGEKRGYQTFRLPTRNAVQSVSPARYRSSQRSTPTIYYRYDVGNSEARHKMCQLLSSASVPSYGRTARFRPQERGVAGRGVIKRKSLANTARWFRDPSTAPDP